MALVDVEFLLSDPDLADDFTVYRSTRSIDENGRTIDTPGTYYAYGVVQPSKEVQLRQLPELERVGSFISVVTPFQLFSLTDTTASDLIVWHYKKYRVKIVRDWTNYGVGFVEAICELISTTQDGPPQ